MAAALDMLRARLAEMGGPGVPGEAPPEVPGEAREEGAAPAASPPRWSRAALAGRVAELSSQGGGGALTLAVGLMAEAQREGEPVAWVGDGESGFYPPDVAANGVDLAALAVVRVPVGAAAGSSGAAAAGRSSRGGGAASAGGAVPGGGKAGRAAPIARAAERLARSGAFGLIVLDLGAGAVLPPALQGRLARLAQRHGTAIVCLTEKGRQAPSLGSLVALRAQVRGRREGPGQFARALFAAKDKRHGPGWNHVEMCHGPPGLR